MATDPRIVQALTALASVDEDRASARNGIGFSGATTSQGNKLAEIVRAGRNLNAQQWASAVRILKIHQKQVLGAIGVDVAAIPDEMPLQPVGPWSRPEPAKFRSRCRECNNPIDMGSASCWRRAADGSYERKHGSCRAPMSVAPASTLAASGGPPARTEATSAADLERLMDLADLTPEDLATRYGIPFGGLDRDGQPDEDAPRSTSVELPMASPAREVLGPGGSIARSLPGYEHREAQLQMTDLVSSAIQDGANAVVEAGTGTGKSLGYLVPAILSGKRTIVSTADKALQEQIVRKDIPFLQAPGHMPIEFTAALLKGRSNYACKYRCNELRSQLITNLDDAATEAWPALDAWLQEQDAARDHADLESYPGPLPGSLRPEVTIDTDLCLGKKCPAYDSCFVERAKDHARHAQVVIVNHALLLRDAVVKQQTDGFISILPEAHTLILDEAHHLEDVATEALATEMSMAAWLRVVSRLERLTVKHKAMDLVGEDQASRVERAEAWQQRWDVVTVALEACFQTLTWRLQDSKATTQKLGDESDTIMPAHRAMWELSGQLADATPSWLAEEEREAWRKITAKVENMAGWLKILGSPAYDDAEVRYAELDRSKKLKLIAKPIEVAELLRDVLWSQYRTAIGTSATITTAGSFEHWQERVGLDQAEALIVGSPFDYRHNALLYLPGDSKKFDPTYPYGGSREYTEVLADEIERLLIASDGRAFCLFTSVRQMNAVHELLAPRLKWRVLKQYDQPRPALVAAFKADGHAVLFGTRSFWEGVDVQGEALSMVIIDKMPFSPPDDPVWEARCQAINRRYDNRWAWFDKLGIPTATIQLKQGFGRLIRTRDDRGTVAILDGRLSSKPYGQKIVGSLPPARVTHRLEDVRAFYTD